MLIDLLYVIILIMAVTKGFSKGLIVAVFSFLAFIIGLAAALKLSAVVAGYLSHSINGPGFLLPFLSFLLVFIGVAFAVKWGAAIVKKAVSIVMLGWIDTLGGVLLYIIIYTMIYSVVLFFATKMHILSSETILASKTYDFVEPFGPKVMAGIGAVVPIFSHMFSDLSNFFAGVSKRV